MKIFTVLFTLQNVSILFQLTASHEDEAYNHNADIGLLDKRDWMKRLPNVPLRELSLIGTHNTVALHGGILAECQSVELLNQLYEGIRALDIRLKLKDGVLKAYHGPIYQNIDFSEILQIVVDFLRSFPSECVVMRIKNEDKNDDPPDPGFERKYKNETARYGSKKIWIANNDNPLLDKVRGKIVVFDDFQNAKKGFGKYGLGWKNETLFDIQDNYDIKHIWGLYNKWEDIQTQFENTNAEKEKFFVNFLSASGLLGVVAPYFAASGHSSWGNGDPRLWTGRLQSSSSYDLWPEFPRLGVLGDAIYFEGLNILTADYLDRYDRIQFLGIVYADYPGRRLITAVINRNICRSTLSCAFEK